MSEDTNGFAEDQEQNIYVGLLPVNDKEAYVKKVIEAMLKVDGFYIEQLTNEIFVPELTAERFTARVIVSAREKLYDRRFLPYYLVAINVFIQADLQAMEKYTGDQNDQEALIEYTNRISDKAITLLVQYFMDGWTNKERGELETAVVGFLRAVQEFLPEDNFIVPEDYITDVNGEENYFDPKWLELINDTIKTI